MKKIILLSSLLTYTSIPLLSFSCSTNKNINEKELVEDFEYLGNFRLKNSNEDYVIEKDGLYIWKESFEGLLWNGNLNTGTINDNEIIPFENGISQLGKNDKIYFLYNEDNNDGLEPKDIQKQLSFLDSSAIGSEKNAYFEGDNVEGKLKNWGVSQNNHMNTSFNDAMMNVKSQVNNSIFNEVAKHYGVLPNPVNGIFVDDPQNNSSKSRAFVPVYAGEDFFSYKRIKNNAYEITFNNKNNINLSSSSFSIKNLNDNTKKSSSLMALGNENEWRAYEHSQTMTYGFISRKEPLYKFNDDQLYNLLFADEERFGNISDKSIFTNILIEDNEFTINQINIDNSNSRIEFIVNDVVKYILTTPTNNQQFTNFDFYEVDDQQNIKNKVEYVYWNSNIELPAKN